MSSPRWWEDFEPGYEVRSSARTVTETDIVFWSALVGDWNPAHVDIEHAKQTPFGQRIAHGNIAFNFSVSLTAMANHGAYRPEGYVRIAGWEKVRFTSPVFIGDTLHAVRTLLARPESDEPDRGFLEYEVQVINQRDEAVMVGVERLLFRKRPSRTGGG